MMNLIEKQKIPLYNEQLEQAVIKYLIKHPESFFDKSLYFKTPNLCFIELNQQVLNFCINKIISHQLVLIHELFNYFKIHAQSLDWLVQKKPRIKNKKEFEYSVNVLYDLYYRRFLFDLVDKTKEDVKISNLPPENVANKLLNDIITVKQKEVYSDLVTISKKSEDEITVLKNNKFFKTGYSIIDTVVHGIIKSHVWIIGGYTNTGKTYVALNLLINLLKQNAKILFFSLEMSSTEVYRRILGIYLGCGVDGYVKNGLTEKERQEEESFIAQYKENLEIIDYARTVAEITAECKRKTVKQNLDVVFIDFIQNIKSKNNEIYDAMRETSLLLQQLAKDLQVTIIALSQLSNEYAKKGGILQYKGAGELAQVADVGIMLTDATDDYIQTNGTLDYTDKIIKPLNFEVVKSRHSPLVSSAMLLEFPAGKLKELSLHDTKNWLSKELKITTQNRIINLDDNVL